jgi:hypothetical protein
MHLHPRGDILHIAPNFDSALELANALIAGTAKEDQPS